jgi:23S rRNA pseudouridine1911/1915/1917 synthase
MSKQFEEARSPHPMKKLPRKGGHRAGQHGAGQRDRRSARFSRQVAVLYEDDAVVALNKPAGLLAVPVEGSDMPSALSIVAAELKSRRQRALIVHRIDRFTSGVLLFAKTDSDRQELVRQFLAHTPVREYLAVVRGRLAVKQGTLVHYFRREGMFQIPTTAKDPEGTRAELRYSVERPLRGATLVRATLVTGLQNQIRVQFLALGHTVIGDRKYSKEEAAERKIARVAVHAAKLQFVHPRSGETISVECELPADFQSLLKSLQLPSRTRR